MTDQTESTRNIPGFIFKCASWLLAVGCFYLVFSRLSAAAGREGITLVEYLVNFLGGVNWVAWFAVMIPYSVFFFLIDSNVTWRAIRWFNAPTLKFQNILPIRASAYILSLLSEQVGKGAMTLYLLRRHKTPGWETLSTMIFLGLMEIYQLLLFSVIGLIYYFEYVVAASKLLPLDTILPILFIAAFTFLCIWIAFFRRLFFKQTNIRNHRYLRAFREAQIKHYVLTVLYKAPNLIGAVIVYTIALNLFNVEASFGQLLVFLPLIFLAAALPLPFHAGALLLWTALFPDYPEVGVFSLFMHTFFVLFNASIGLVFLPKANRELIDESS
ncbi:MAG: hypothetical protein F4W90_12145 [Gammaproteobacteria bacterium]|nr:hypothetical protein [Gammaproteobacteria bacterium]